MSLKEISEHQDISKKYLEQIVPMLNKSGILRTNRGNKGGYMLAKDPRECTVGDILRITEGSLAVVPCVEQDPIECKRSAECAVLLKSAGDFPLAAPCTIALYGSGARRTVKGGTGSGEVNSRHFVTAEEVLEAAGFNITSKSWMISYENTYLAARKAFIRGL